jgi:hypothetical protein
MNIELLAEWEMAAETGILGKNLWPPHTQHDLTRNGRLWLTTWAATRRRGNLLPPFSLSILNKSAAGFSETLICIKQTTTWYTLEYPYTSSDNKVRELIAASVLRTFFLSITVVAFKVPLCEAMHRFKSLVHPLKQFWNWICEWLSELPSCYPDVINVKKCLLFNISFIFGDRRKSLGARSSE